MKVSYRGVSKSFGTVQALAPLDLDVPEGAFLALLGPSGCGKTTALRLLAGLEQPTTGRICIGERDVTTLAPRDRDVAMVFQSYALYPHMTVGENIGYPLRIRKVRKDEKARQVAEVAELLGIERLLDRRPRQLSGGQRQRVALARAIVRHPKAFLMDEPLSNLDAQLRLQMRAEIKRLQRELGVTTLYVTHDQIEAMTMADLVAVMRNGELQQLATPGDLYAHPANIFVARFVGSPPMNVVAGEVAGEVFTRPEGTLTLAGDMPSGPVTLGFRPEHATVVPAGAANALRAEVYVVEPLGPETLVTVRVGSDIISVRAPAGFTSTIGEPCAVLPDPEQIHLFDQQSGTSLVGENATKGAVR